MIQLIILAVGSIVIYSLWLAVQAACTKIAIEVILEQPILFDVLNDRNRPAAKMLAKQNRLFKRFAHGYSSHEPTEAEDFLCHRIAADIKEHLLAIDRNLYFD